MVIIDITALRVLTANTCIIGYLVWGVLVSHSGLLKGATHGKTENTVYSLLFPVKKFRCFTFFYLHSRKSFRSYQLYELS